MDIFFVFNQLRFVFLLFLSYLSNGFHKVIAFFDEKKTKESKQVKKTETELFIEKRQKLFLKTFTDTNTDLLEWNLNIKSGFYSKLQYQEMIKDAKNSLEQQWKTRLLFETTPRGVVIMYYDPFKLGFSYYSDQSIPYNILNAMAMKYVIHFRCRDFFMDEYILPENTPLPLLKLLLEDKATNEKTENSEKQKGNETIKQRLRNAPFAKFKNYNKNQNKDEKKGEKKGEKDTTEKKEPEKPKEQNRFISLGKTHNFKMLQSVPKKKKAMSSFKPTKNLIRHADSYSPGSITDKEINLSPDGADLNLHRFKSTLASSLLDNSSVQKEVFNYRDFKKMAASSFN